MEHPKLCRQQWQELSLHIAHEPVNSKYLCACKHNIEKYKQGVFKPGILGVSNSLLDNNIMK